MLKVFRFFFTSNRRRRCRTTSLALCLLRMVCEAEEVVCNRYSEKLDNFDNESVKVSRHNYLFTEDLYIESECTVGMLRTAIEDLEYLY